MSIQFEPYYPTVGWSPVLPVESLSFLEEVSAIVAYALLWIQSCFSEDSSRLLGAFNADQALLDDERYPGPRHTPLVNMRSSFLQILDVENTDRVEACISVIGWSDDSTIERSGFDPVVAHAVSHPLKQQLHLQFIDFRRQVRQHVKSVVSVWFGVMQNREYLRSKAELELSITSLVQHFDRSS